MFSSSTTSPATEARPGGGRVWSQLGIATNWPVLVAVCVLCAVGIQSIWADTRLEPHPDWPKQIAFLVASLLCMAAFQAVDYRFFSRIAWGFYAFSLLLILYTVAGTKVHLPGVKAIKGACNWINFGPVSLQPAELMKVGFVLALSRYLRFRSNYRTFAGLLAPFALALVPIAAILKQPDLGTALIFIPTLFAMLFVAGARKKHLFAIVGLALLVAPILWLSGSDQGRPGLPLLRHLPTFVKPYQRERVLAMFNSDPQTLERTGYQQQHALTAFGSGGLTGKGAGNIEVGRKVPEGHNDMIYALIGEQFGLVGAGAVLLAYLVLFVAGLEIASTTRESFGRMVAVGIVTMLAGQTFLNVMVAVKLMPVTGVTLPFISYGGSSLLASFMAVGLLLNIGQNRIVVMGKSSFEFD